jgi:hypothetical protein
MEAQTLSSFAINKSQIGNQKRYIKQRMTSTEQLITKGKKGNLFFVVKPNCGTEFTVNVTTSKQGLFARGYITTWNV